MPSASEANTSIARKNRMASAPPSRRCSRVMQGMISGYPGGSTREEA
jgi:hypothetical protein